MSGPLSLGNARRSVPGYFERRRLRRRAPVLASVRRGLDLLPSSRLLDLGGGSGAVTEAVGFDAREIAVTDPARRRLAGGRSRRPWISFVRTTAERLPFESGSFERVMSTMAYHHFHDPDQVLRESARVLTSDGRLVLCDFDPTSPLGRRLRWLEATVLRHAYHFETREQVVARCVSAGFAIVHEESVGPFYVVTARPRAAPQSGS